jgi:fluoroacetyl-CoA thioesterase
MSKETERLTVGTRHRLQMHVDERLTVPALSSAFTGVTDMPPVLATAFMVGFIEWACIELLRTALPPDFKTVGTHIDVSHVAPTPVGMTVMAEVELISVAARNLRFHVQCSDEAGLIGQGTHERAIVDSAKFLKRVSAKRALATRERGNV